MATFRFDWRVVVLVSTLASSVFTAAQASQIIPSILSDSIPAASARDNATPRHTPPSAAANVRTTQDPEFNRLIERVVENERLFLARMRNLRPVAETYLQTTSTKRIHNLAAVKDQYFLGRLDMSNGDISLAGEAGREPSYLGKLKELYAVRFQPAGFAQMIAIDTDFETKNYDFTYVQREFLGAVRCIVIDVRPKANAPRGKFEGRIWIDDQDDNVVRFNGTYTRPAFNSFYLHFDSWRQNVRPGVWLPSVIYSEESHLKDGHGDLGLKAQTRLWGYDAKWGKQGQEYTQISVDAQQANDTSDSAADANPIAAEGMWEQQAAGNIIGRLQKVGMLAPPGPVDAMLETVVNNLALTNNLFLAQAVHCRVLLTTPLESFTVGNTIVLSRGLIDVLPDEASLAMVLSHELSHIVLGHRVDTQFAFYDRMFVSDKRVLNKLNFRRSPADEEAANTKAIELLKNSPYKQNLANAGLFLRQLQQRASDFPSLIRPHVGNGLPAGANTWMWSLVASAPGRNLKRGDQIAALPLGSRIKVDPWSSQIAMEKRAPLFVTAADNMPFELTPVFPYLTRLSNEEGRATGSTAGGSK